MASHADLEVIAKTAEDDFYNLLGVTFDSSTSDIKRAYRKTSLRYHPDKNPDNAAAADLFIRLGHARDILLDAALKTTYDTARLRRKEKALQHEMLDSRRRAMKEELERREREGKVAMDGLKRKRGEEQSEAERREQELQRLAEDGKRRRREMAERLERQWQEEEASLLSSTATPEPEKPQTKSNESPEIDRTVKIRFPRTPETEAWDKQTLTTMFSKYGQIDSIVIGKDKKIRIEGSKHRSLIALVFIVYKRLYHAHAAVMDAKTDYPALESVTWAGNKEPEIVSPFNAPTENGNGEATTTAPSTPRPAFTGSFRESIGSKGFGTPGTPTFSFSPGPKTPSLEDVTMMRLKQAEKKRLEEQIRRQEAEEEKAAAAATAAS
ncbi:DnaJ-domain-containing protein [Sporormia fimetaria CBS 119925]|uniref:DnaJ-domain-containing protein n=1 Tax=Sporormia fimetaria CBS 119925 TaxID=1340428 RepID=A0A6A6V8T8_9PLEO|nr:DnaJ-domain-containing protein [Sporormia fimetaria CBS 119925]